ncbi:hypothetical protein Pint_12278 [Pistacia integerrima]|uniref:Uncharacterized protein n=1 Tax=Pistacia integerrima TaxID=434235 RepID=A0ACC0XL87_9ROSI|nr:hypothetical protein Pint_12278 [Pistacia integerrima]
MRVNENNHSIFHVAVLNRQKDIFGLIDDIDPEFKKLILEKEDDEKTISCIWLGMMPPQERLNIVSGVALQLQQELFWFDVKKLVNPKHAGAKNKKGRTPTDIHTEKITTLKDKGEKWMKDTANSCMIVATLITTVVFAAAFTVPDEDFLKVLPITLVVGLSTLFFSIATMMVVFCTTIFVVYKDGKIWVPILVTAFASLPVILFTQQQWKLIYDVARNKGQKEIMEPQEAEGRSMLELSCETLGLYTL